MRIDAALAALCHDPAPATGAGQAALAWRNEAGIAPLLDDLARYGAGAALDSCPALADLFGGAATAVARGAAAGAVAVLRAQPLGFWPWRHFSNGVLHSAVLGASGDASLSLALIDGPAWRAARDPAAVETVAFQPGVIHAAVVAGRGAARILRNRSIDPSRAQIEAAALALAPGVAYRLDGADEALAIDRIEGVLVTLRLHRRSAGNVPARQYYLATGALRHQAASEQRDSRAELIMALLRASGRSDAAPVLAELARTGAASARWQALRECLALDSDTGFAELLAVATRSGDPLAPAAAALIARLAAQDTAFAQAREAMSCPA